VAAGVVVVLAVAGALLGVGSVEPYPTLRVETTSTEVVLSVLLLVVALSPFAGRSARMGVARV
jgi:hypothetical protein